MRQVNCTFSLVREGHKSFKITPDILFRCMLQPRKVVPEACGTYITMEELRAYLNMLRFGFLSGHRFFLIVFLFET